MPTIKSLRQKYQEIGESFEERSDADIDSSCLLAFDYEYSGQETEIAIDTEEFTAVCPWTSLPDFGTLAVAYVPDRLCLELKSLKYYLLSYRGVGIVQEHAANRILNDLVASCQPLSMDVTLDYTPRGGLHTTVSARYDKPDQAAPNDVRSS